MLSFVEVMVIGSFLIAELVLLVSSLTHYIYAFVSIFSKPRTHKVKKGALPFITIQIPVYNEGEVCRKAIDACLKLNYPKKKYEIIVCDDSTDEITSEIISSYGKKIKHLKRKTRRGYKAGALNDALKKSKGKFIAVFDADFEPEADFLKKAASVVEKEFAVVQGRWHYRNEDKTIVSKTASMMNDAFYEVVMKFRSFVGTVMFSGSGGLIRKNAIIEVGGWNEKSVSEDLDLTIRLLCSGWKTAYYEKMESRGEAPSTLTGFIKQQSRWAFGTSEAALKYLGGIWRTKKLNLVQKIDLSQSTFGYFAMPFIIVAYLSGVVNFFTRWIDPEMGLWILITIGTLGYFFELIVAAMHSSKFRNLVFLPVLFLFLVIMNFPLAKGVLEAIIGREKEFQVTPKLGD